MAITFKMIEAAVHPREFKSKDGGESYNNATNWLCKCILAAGRRDPQAFKAAMDAYRENPYGSDIDELLLPEEREEADDMTGFMWGWAVQTATYLTEQDSVPNGAIITIG